MTMFKSPHDRRRTSPLAAAAGVILCFSAAFAGCGDAPELVPRGAWSLAFAKPPGSSCGPGQHNIAVGEVTADSRTKLFDDQEQRTAGDASTVVNVFCSTIASGSGFSVELDESSEGSILKLLVSELPSGATKDKPAKGTVYYQSAQTAQAFTANDCNFYFLKGQSISEGKGWLTFDCPQIAAGPDNVCAIDVGYAAFENCHTEADQGG